jgi:tyrosine-protein kinase
MTSTGTPHAAAGAPDSGAPRGLDAQALLLFLRRRWLVIVLTVLAAVGTAVALSVTQEKKYTATASLLFRDPGLDQKLFGSSYFARSADPSREAATNTQLVGLDQVAVRTARRLGNRLTPGEIRARTTISPRGQSDVVAIDVTDEDPRFAATIANSFALEFIAFRRAADRANVQAALKLVERQLASLSPDQRSGTRGRSLRARGEELQVLTELQTGNAELVQHALPPSSPSSPKPRRNAVIGGFLGLLFGLLLAGLFERLDRRIREPEEVETIFGRPSLGSIPLLRGIGRRRNPDAADAEAFHMLRANLRYFNAKAELRSVLVTSAAPGEGKSTVSWNLGVAAAQTGMKVLLLETDLRQPTLGTRLSNPIGLGLSSVLAGDVELEAVVQHFPETTNGTGGRATMDVVTSGPLPPNPIDLLESARMHSLLKRAESEYDLVIIDSPPTLVVSDAIPLLRDVTGVIVVVRIDSTSRDAARRLAAQLAHLEAPVLGVVANCVPVSSQNYGYVYGYGQRVSHESETQPGEFTADDGGVRNDEPKPALQGR